MISGARARQALLKRPPPAPSPGTDVTRGAAMMTGKR